MCLSPPSFQPRSDLWPHVKCAVCGMRTGSASLNGGNTQVTVTDQGGVYDPTGLVTGATSIYSSGYTQQRNGGSGERTCIKVYKGAGTLKTVGDQNSRFGCGIIAPFAQVLHDSDYSGFQHETTVIARSYSLWRVGQNGECAAPSCFAAPMRPRPPPPAPPPSFSAPAVGPCMHTSLAPLVAGTSSITATTPMAT